MEKTIRKVKQELKITLLILMILIIVFNLLIMLNIKNTSNKEVINLAIEKMQNYGENEETTLPPSGDNASLEGWDLGKVVPITSDDGVIVPVPAGFVQSANPSERTVENGFVIIQAGTGSEFVWVPVPNPEEMFMKDSEGNDTGQLYKFPLGADVTKIAYSKNKEHEIDITEYDSREQYLAILGLGSAEQFKEQLKAEFAQMKSSVERYKGFYIGRYETGNLSKPIAVVTRNNIDTYRQNWYVQYQKNKTIAVGTSANSHMIWGCQWDAALRWFVKQGGMKKYYVYCGTEYGNFSETVGALPTGSNPKYSINNIYDMAGNLSEWTMEAKRSKNSYCKRKMFD